MRVVMFVASEEATSGSVMQNADRIDPSSSGLSHRACCSGVPNIVSTSMFPVSGAAQFVASGASAGLRPVISASGAYCRFVNPAPCSPGRNRFHRPRRRASAFRSSITGTRAHGSAAVATCSAYTASAGYTCSSMNASSSPRNCSVRSSNAKSIYPLSSPASAARPSLTSPGTRSPIRSNPAPTVLPCVKR